MSMCKIKLSALCLEISFRFIDLAHILQLTSASAHFILWRLCSALWNYEWVQCLTWVHVPAYIVQTSFNSYLIAYLGNICPQSGHAMQTNGHSLMWVSLSRKTAPQAQTLRTCAHCSLRHSERIVMYNDMAA